MKITTGDLVLVIAGKDKGKQGQVLRVFSSDQRAVVEGINMRVRHIKKTQQSPGQKISFEGTIHLSNLMIVDPKTKKPTRIGYKVDEKTGKKQRIAKKSGEVIVKAATKVKADAGKKADAPKAGGKSFWRGGGNSKDDSGTKGRSEGGTSFTTAHRSQGG